MDFRTELNKQLHRTKWGAKLYVRGTGKCWEAIRASYKTFADINLEDSVYAFVDNDKNKQGGVFYGKPVLPPSEIDFDDAVVMLAVGDMTDMLEIRDELVKYLMNRVSPEVYTSQVFLTWVFDQILKSYLFLQLLRFKGRHDGQRCFIIGNGPSLLPSDLDRLKREMTFATNQIYLIFGKTEWRPTYYMAADFLTLKNYEKINKSVKGIKFFNADGVAQTEGFRCDDAYFFGTDYIIEHRPYPYNRPYFSESPDRLCYGGTVTYSCIQMAAYMGFEDIILLGMDHRYRFMLTYDNAFIESDVQEHFYAQSIPSGFSLDEVNDAYETARTYADGHGIRIRNATRGGKLEVFERVDFDSLF
jgi:hypothetical protein